jgi:hypothetical protein
MNSSYYSLCVLFRLTQKNEIDFGLFQKTGHIEKGGKELFKLSATFYHTDGNYRRCYLLKKKRVDQEDLVE